jgi:DNA-binding MarR family transcriptional regulator
MIAFFKQLDLTEQQYNVLRILRGQFPKPCNLKLIKERMLDKMSDTSRIIDKLLKKELVERTQCFDDRRNVDILISEKGMVLINSLDYVDENIYYLFKTLTKEDIEVLNNLLDKIRD